MGDGNCMRRMTTTLIGSLEFFGQQEIDESMAGLD